jgi:hypothetical protein
VRETLTAADKDRLAKFQRAKTHCPSGHPYNEANTWHYRDRRYCRACHRARVRATREEAQRDAARR